MIMEKIEKLGFNNWFQDKVDLSKTTDLKIVRVISVNKNSSVVSNGEKDIYSELTGKFFNSAMKEIKNRRDSYK